MYYKNFKKKTFLKKEDQKKTKITKKSAKQTKSAKEDHTSNTGNEFDNSRVVPAKKLPIDLDVQLLVGGEIRRIQISYLLWIG